MKRQIILEAALVTLRNPKQYDLLAEYLGASEFDMQNARDEIENELTPIEQQVATHAAVEHSRAVANLYA